MSLKVKALNLPLFLHPFTFSLNVNIYSECILNVSPYSWHEHLDFNVTAKAVAQSASRALGLLIAKCKSVGGMPYDVYTKLYNTLVWPVINYGAAIWGTRTYSCIDAVHNRAMRFFLGVGKYTPNAAVAGEMVWIPPFA